MASSLVVLLASALCLAAAIGILRPYLKRSQRSAHDGDDDDDDIYAHLDVAVLNAHRALPGQPHTEWMNMGWWTPTACSCGITFDSNRGPNTQRNQGAAGQDVKAFSDACHDLASMLWAHAGLDMDTDASRLDATPPRPLRILDVGFGYGQSLLSLLEEHARGHHDHGPTISTPQNTTSSTPTLVLHGVTLSPAEHARAEQRIQKHLASFVTADRRGKHAEATSPPRSEPCERGDVEVSLFCSDATSFLGDQSRRSEPQPGYDFIFALDCAYHMDRAAFFRAAHGRLRPGGVLALFDLFQYEPPVLNGDIDGASNPTRAQSPSLYSRFCGLLGHARSQLFPALTLRLLFALSGASLLTKPQYLQVLRDAGFAVTTQICDVTPHVFPGFANFLSEVGSSRLDATTAPGLRTLPPLTRYGLRTFGRLVGKWAGSWAALNNCSKRPDASTAHLPPAAQPWAQVWGGIVVARKQGPATPLR